MDDDPDNPSPERIQRNREERAACLAAWPEAYDDGYDPRCCRFPKACSIPNDPDRPKMPAGPTSPEDAVAWLRSAADAVNVAAFGYNPPDWRDALRLLDDLRKALRILGQVDANLSRWLYLNGEHGQHQHVDGISGEFAIGRRRSKENWAGDDGVRDYVAKCIEAIGGEYPDPDQVVEWVLEVVPSLTSAGLRKTPLRDKGLDPANYVTSEPGTIYVDLPRGT